MKVLFGLLALLASELSAETLILSVSANAEDPNILQILEGERLALRSLGYEVQFRAFPGVRGLIEADAGRIDGDAARTTLAVEPYQHLVQVPESIGKVELRAYALQPYPLSIPDWVKRGLRIGAPSGVRWAEIEVRPLIDPHLWTSVPESAMGLKMLAAGRLDVWLGLGADTKGLLKANNITNARDLGVVVSVDMYLYLNEKWAKLGPLLTAALRATTKEKRLLPRRCR